MAMGRPATGTAVAGGVPGAVATADCVGAALAPERPRLARSALDAFTAFVADDEFDPDSESAGAPPASAAVWVEVELVVDWPLGSGCSACTSAVSARCAAGWESAPPGVWAFAVAPAWLPDGAVCDAGKAGELPACDPGFVAAVSPASGAGNTFDPLSAAGAILLRDAGLSPIATSDVGALVATGAGARLLTTMTAATGCGCVAVVGV
jgi:hypothetical protein